MSDNLTDEQIFEQLEIALQIPIESEDELEQYYSSDEDTECTENLRITEKTQIAHIPDQPDIYIPEPTPDQVLGTEEVVETIAHQLDNSPSLSTTPEPKPSTSTITNENLPGNRTTTRRINRKVPVAIHDTPVPIKQTQGTVKYRNTIWKISNCIQPNINFVFTGKTALPDEILDLESPLQFFNFFFTKQLFEKICNETLAYSIQIDPNRPFHITENDLRKYLGICVLMSIIHLPNTRNYWNDVLGNKTIIDTMPVKHFEMVRKHLHFNDNTLAVPTDSVGHDRLHKIRPIIDNFNERCALVPLEESLSVDEQMCATKVRHFLKQYMPNKPHKWGYKLFILAGVSGFCYKAEVYSGLENDPLLRAQYNEKDLGPSANIVTRLARNIPSKCHFKLYFDNYYTTLPLLVELEKRDIHSLGTFRRNRFPGVKLSSEKDLNKNSRGFSEECVTTIDGVEIRAVTWKDNKVVSLASTFVGKYPEKLVKRFDRKERKTVQVDCPEIVTVYNHHMGGGGWIC